MDYPEDVLRIPLEKLNKGSEDEERVGSEEELANLAEHIEKNELLEPIVVCKADGDTYDIIAGFRRRNAYEKLNKKYPGEGWDKIPARSRGDCGGIEDTPTMNAR